MDFGSVMLYVAIILSYIHMNAVGVLDHPHPPSHIHESGMRKWQYFIANYSEYSWSTLETRISYQLFWTTAAADI